MPVDVTTEITIARTVDDVAWYAADPSNAPAWYVNIESVEWETSPPARPGSRVAFVARFLGRRLSYIENVQSTRYGPRRRDRTTDLLAAKRTLDIVDTGCQRLETQLDRTCGEHENRARYQHDHHDELTSHTVLETRIGMRLDDLIDSYGTDLPEYLKLIGPRPRDDLAQVHWRAAAHAIETYRTINNTDPERTLGSATERDHDGGATRREVARHLNQLHLYAPRQQRAHQHGHAIEADIGIEL